MALGRPLARDSHLCASITDDHSRVHFVVHVFDAALTDKEVKGGGGPEEAREGRAAWKQLAG